MKTLVVYYSRSGTTKKIAEEISKKAKCDIEEIVDNKNRKGIIGWLISGRDAHTKKLTTIKEMKTDPSKYDIVAIGTPIWAGLMAPAVRTYIDQNKGKFKNVGFFCTCSSSGDIKAFEDMEDYLGITPLSKLTITGKDLKSNYDSKIKDFIKGIK
ncbi:MAG: flavodoxin [Candidatus Methanofastidiosum methylothiophilum]|uniref:Flavodoxin n=1 Tax=Candidatus Methanofastidiosum methylothiophilum TaxID=1705564 RepID=A0A150IJV5_9EURY|nr:MAG: flavodoxin [Candidatus Methanofastidiosum methylthiophilus]KYC47330.1 MAG: flavodoxin [Candidatus Methanofastidiosum methylthiophilus]KYC49781.1 MAG: flavodoxin [Candidatus Methanofastidiosum methylthiophilus]